MIVPKPLPISCTDCHRQMWIEHQSIEHNRDAVIVAAECACGRIIGIVTGMRMAQRAAQPLTRADIVAEDIGASSAALAASAREYIAELERRIAAATWANGGRKP